MSLSPAVLIVIHRMSYDWAKKADQNSGAIKEKHYTN